jgi:S-DNA-T family DNA segregation ATPase FtsK/SpoIIIE
MRIALTALTPQGPADVIVSGDDGATARQVAEALQAAFAPTEHLAPVIMHPRAAHGRAAALAGPGPVLWAGGQRIPPDTPAAQALRDGSVVTTLERAAVATSLAEPGGVAELRVIGGPDAGTVHRLGPGVTTIGSGPACQVRLQSPGVPAHAGAITVAWGLNAPAFDPAGSQAQLLLDGRPVSEACTWPFGGVLRIATTALQLMRPETPDAHLSPAGGGLAYHRPPRFRPDLKPVKIGVPAEPKKGHGTAAIMLLGAAAPMAMGAVMVYLTRQWIYSLFMLMSPLMVLGYWASERKQRGGAEGSYRRKMRAYTKQMAEVEDKLVQVKAADEKRRRDDAMDPAQVLLTATGPRRRLWERRADDPDTLRMRIGLFDGPAMIQMVGPKDAELPAVPTSFCVPVSMPLTSMGVVGLAGPVDASRALARWLVAQAAVLHSPRDLSIVVLAADPAAAPHWNWVRWLPHCAPRGGEDCVALVGTDPDSAARRVSELVTEVSARLGSAGEGPLAFGGGADQAVPGSDLGAKILVVLDGARQLRRIPGMPQVLAAAKKAGVYAVCIDESHRVLPEECAAVLSWDIPGQATASSANGVHYGPGGWASQSHGQAARRVRPFLIRGHGSVFGHGGPAILADQVSIGWADRVARALAPVRDVSRDDADSVIPDSARLLDLIHMPDPSPDLVLHAWQRRGRTTKVPIGVSADGPFILDLSADGPHGLVAGTTGAGKSELLQTLIAVLCVANRPDAMTFVLIDYKGGSAFKDCARLPHTVGMVSDLDGHLTVRALDSLGAELKRREELLLHAGAKDIEDYWDTKKLRPDLEPVPRLVLIIDEFAAMVAELPDFVTGLIDIARRGRSLGVHLLLATQRPAGVVSADIRANTNLRIALRVTSADESADVIDTRDAAFIAKSTPGRCYIRSGASSPVAVQSARIGGRRPSAGPVTASARVVPLPWRGLGKSLPAPAASGHEESMATDLSVLVDAIAAANAKLGLSPQRRPWLEPLPDLITLGELSASGTRGDSGARGDGGAGAEGGGAGGGAGAGGGGGAGSLEILPIPYGLIDLPLRQARAPLALDFSHAGHIAVAGAARTGRSSLLRTLAGSVVSRVSPADVHIYGIDCGTGALLPVAGLPHCGAVVTREQGDRIERLLSKLRNEITRRQQLLAAQGFAGLAEQRAATTGESRLPWMLLLLDWWEGYVATFENLDYGRLIETLLQILREGSAVGLRAVVTTDRTALIGQTGTIFGQRMIFRMTDRSDASLADIGERALPAHQAEGRIMFAAKPNPLEAQIALLDHDASGVAQVAALRRIGEQARQRFGRPPAEQRPLRVDALPPRITLAETYRLDPDFAPPSPLWALAGAGGDQLGPQGIDIRDEGPGVVIAGPARSGRSTTLLTMARSLIAAQTPILIITPRRSPLRALDGTPGVIAVLGADFDIEFLRAELNPLDRYVVMVDDAEMLVDAPNAPVLERIIVTGRDADHGLILAGTTGDLGRCYTGFIPAALKSRCGVLVTVDTPDDGDLFGVRLPRNAAPGPMGRGLILRPGRVAPIQLAVDDE